MEWDGQILNFLSCPEDGGNFDALGLELFRRQCERIPAYAEYCERFGCDPKAVKHVREAPALPQAMYKSGVWLGSEPKGEYTHVFRTSGTTTGRRGERPVARMDVYEESCLRGIERFLSGNFPGLLGASQPGLPEMGQHTWRVPLFFVKESPRDTPHSSLSWMFEFWRRGLGVAGSGFLFAEGRFSARLMEDFLRQEPERQVLLAGTALGLMEWAESGGERLVLPPGSVILETGGFKGKRREVEKVVLYGVLAEFFGVPVESIVNEYGMTELFSQAYSVGPAGAHVLPPWLSVRVVDPRTGQPAPDGQPGILEFFDLANVDCVPAVQTEDLGIFENGRLRVLGRVSTELRGCSMEGPEL